jgi:hypothetical protein
VYAADRTRDRTWQLLGALFIAGWMGSFLARVLLLARPGEAPPLTNALLTIAVGTVFVAVALRYVVPQTAGVELWFVDACAVAVVGQLPVALLFALGGAASLVPAISGVSLMLSLLTVALQYIVLRALVAPASEPTRELVVEALACDPEPEYESVLAGIRETTAAVDQAFVLPSAAGDSILDELTALAAHARRLRKLGPPERGARVAHDALLAELARYQDQLIVARGEARADLYSGHRIRELVAELAGYVRRQP